MLSNYWVHAPKRHANMSIFIAPPEITNTNEIVMVKCLMAYLKVRGYQFPVKQGQVHLLYRSPG